MLPLESLKDMRPYFATPCYAMQTASVYSMSMFLMGFECGKRGVEAWLEHRSESALTWSRNAIVARFRANTSYTHLVWWDADVMAGPEQVFRLLLADKDIAAGVPPIKQFNWPKDGVPAGTSLDEFVARSSTYPFFPTELSTDDDGFAKVVYVPTGLMCIKRSVFDKLEAAYQHLNYIPNGAANPGPKSGLYWNFYDNMIDPISRHPLTEDFRFCRLWIDLGGEIWADTTSQLGHLGQHLWLGNLGEKLYGQEARQIQEAA